VTARKNLWGSRFREKTSPSLARLNDSLAFDRELLAEDVAGSIAWAQALGRSRVLRPAEVNRLVAGLREVARAAAPGTQASRSYFLAAAKPRSPVQIWTTR